MPGDLVALTVLIRGQRNGLNARGFGENALVFDTRSEGSHWANSHAWPPGCSYFVGHF
jgi:hypothetical protein